MNNTSLPCITATAGTRFGQDNIDRKLSFIIYLPRTIYTYKVSSACPQGGTCVFLQVAGSVVRLLTNIPHCCTIRIGVFSDPMWSINLSVTTTSLS